MSDDAGGGRVARFFDRRVSWLALFLLFYGICLGQGYATLNRYDPRSVLLDPQSYVDMSRGHYDSVAAPFRFRVLIPSLDGFVGDGLRHLEIGTWDVDMLAALLVTSGFTAGAGLLLVYVGSLLGDALAGVIAALLYLASFTVVHYYLAAMVDAGEGFVLVAVAAATLARNPWLAVALVAASGLAKETAPLFASAYLATAWVWSRWVSRKADSAPARMRLLPVVCAVLAGAATVLIVRQLVGDGPEGTEQIGHMGLLAVAKASFHIVAAPTMVYAFLYLLPLALPRLCRLPREWVLGSLVMACLAVVGGAYADIGTNVFRPLFNTVGPCLAMAGGMMLVDLARSIGPPADAEVRLA